MAAQTTRQPRGIRNNNPLNIRKSANRWKHKIEPSTDRDFEQFDAMVWGIRAAFCIIRTYLGPRYKCRTVADVINRWAPPVENVTTKYIDFVLCRGLLGRNVPLTFTSKSQMCRLVWAMAWYECGRKIDYSLVESAYDLV